MTLKNKIQNLQKKGFSLRKIAEQLNVTFGEVRYEIYEKKENIDIKKKLDTKIKKASVSFKEDKQIESFAKKINDKPKLPKNNSQQTISISLDTSIRETMEGFFKQINDNKTLLNKLLKLRENYLNNFFQTRFGKRGVGIESIDLLGEEEIKEIKPTLSFLDYRIKIARSDLNAYLYSSRTIAMAITEQEKSLLLKVQRLKVEDERIEKIEEKAQIKEVNQDTTPEQLEQFQEILRNAEMQDLQNSSKENSFDG
jgi:hypothetical protein